ncbi:hypothetical protein L3Q82_011329 [Scortum barcoo]|uniref:Uncharacterized protein n=1 Tax=Scortum barcoo TaxID=214431 RepID=A0ACB8WA30_9TELE|nr:hypothetical protein L3Q82_011329 [Scortum barcoo]
MEEDYRSASKRFWQTVRRLRRGKQYSANTVYSAGGELLTSTGDIVGRWKKYFEDLLNPTDLPSNEEAEAGVSEVDSSITQAEVTEVVRKLLSGKAPGVDEIRPEYLKSLDVVGLSWLTRLCNIAWRLGTVPLGITLLSLPGKVYARVLERRIRPIVDHPGFRRNNAVFVPGRGTLDQLYTLHRVLEGLWEFAQPVHMCFVGSGEGIRPCPSWPGPSACTVLERFAAECEAAGMRISTSKSMRPWFSTGKGWHALSRWVERSCLKWRSSSISGSCSRVRERSEREIDRRIGAASRSYAVGRVPGPSVVKKELSRKREALDLPVNLRSPPSPMVMRTLGNDRKDKIADKSKRRNEFPPQGGWALP